jgi:hypothetical protein
MIAFIVDYYELWKKDTFSSDEIILNCTPLRIIRGVPSQVLISGLFIVPCKDIANLWISLIDSGRGSAYRGGRHQQTLPATTFNVCGISWKGYSDIQPGDATLDFSHMIGVMKWTNPFPCDTEEVVGVDSFYRTPF